MKQLFILLISAVLLNSCSRKMYQVPSCIQQKIEEIKTQRVWNPPAQINEYEYNGKRVFLISADCCDKFETLVDENCNYICAPSGGFSGRGDGKCTDFSQTAKHIRLVWKDERAKQ